MRPPLPTFTGLCDRCGNRYITGAWPPLALCSGCHLGAMTPGQRGRTLAGGRVA